MWKLGDVDTWRWRWAMSGGRIWDLPLCFCVILDGCPRLTPGKHSAAKHGIVPQKTWKSRFFPFSIQLLHTGWEDSDHRSGRWLWFSRTELASSPCFARCALAATWRCPSQGETSFKTWQDFATRWRAQIPHTDNHGQGHKRADCFMTRDHLRVLAVHGVSWVLEYHVLEAVTTKSTTWNKTQIHKVGSEASVCFQPTAVFCHMLQACRLSTLYNFMLIPQHVEYCCSYSRQLSKT